MRRLVAGAFLILAAWAPAGAVECFTPARWQPKLVQTVMDKNGNFIHDSLDALDPLGRGGGNCPGCVGVAPGAGLVDIKVFGPELPILPAVLGGMQAVIRNKQQLEIDVVNMSYANCLATDGTDTSSPCSRTRWCSGAWSR